MKIFELYDEVTGGTISHHKTIKGAIRAASDAMQKLAEPLEKDYGDVRKVDFKLSFRIQSIEVKE